MPQAATHGTMMSRPDGARALLIKLRYIRQETDGRLYVRRAGRSIRLREDPASEAFYAEYARALEATGSLIKPTKLKASQGSLGWLVQQYLTSMEYRSLAPSSQATRRRTLEAICTVHGYKPYSLMAERHVRKIRDEKVGRPEAANMVLKALRALFAWALEAQLANRNPAKAVAKIKYKSDGIHTWTLDEVAQYKERWPAGTKQRLALALLLYTGVRRGDAVRLGRQMVRDGWLT